MGQKPGLPSWLLSFAHVKYPFIVIDDLERHTKQSKHVHSEDREWQPRLLFN